MCSIPPFIRSDRVDDADGSEGLPALDEFLRHLLNQTDCGYSAGQTGQLGADLVDLQRWLESMPVIEQAKGILMGHYGIDAQTAFDVLRRWSTHHNIKIRTISHQLTAAASHHKPPENSTPGNSEPATDTPLNEVIAIFNRDPG